VLIPIDLTGDARDEAHSVTVNPADDSITVTGTAFSGDAGNSQVAVARVVEIGNLDDLFGLHGITTFGFDDPDAPA
jgi:hypothetical protein